MEIDKSGSDVIETSTARIWLGQDGIIYFIYKPQVDVGLEETQENADAVRQVSCGQKRPMLVDIRTVRSATREAREVATSVEILTSAAIIVHSPVTVMIGNLFLLINKPTFPNRLFRSESEALEWLKEFTK